jgi:hypothetical protein
LAHRERRDLGKSFQSNDLTAAGGHARQIGDQFRFPSLTQEFQNLSSLLGYRQQSNSQLTPRLNIMVIHAIDRFERSRPTTLRNFWALAKYCDEARFYYHYFDDAISTSLRSIPFDVIILDTTFLCLRWARPRSFFDNVKEQYSWLSSTDAILLAFPQDDYDHAHILDDWLADYGVDKVYSVCQKQFHDLIYPRMSREDRVGFILTGYIDDDDVAIYASLQKPFETRSRDVGYRVRRLPPNFGTFGMLKSEFGRIFSERSSGGYVVDISDDSKDTIIGEEWPSFLGDCRFALGCESGSSIVDVRGEIRDAMEAALSGNPTATPMQIIQASAPVEATSREFSVPSPRLFEIALAGCCPILLEGDYLGLIRPEEHYISVKRDFSDIDVAIARMSDLESSNAIAARYRDAILGNDSLRYKNWAKRIFSDIADLLRDRKGNGQFTNWQFQAAVESQRSFLRSEHRNYYLSQLESCRTELHRSRPSKLSRFFGLRRRLTIG